MYGSSVVINPNICSVAVVRSPMAAFGIVLVVTSAIATVLLQAAVRADRLRRPWISLPAIRRPTCSSTSRRSTIGVADTWRWTISAREPVSNSTISKSRLLLNSLSTKPGGRTSAPTVWDGLLNLVPSPHLSVLNSITFSGTSGARQ